MRRRCTDLLAWSFDYGDAVVPIQQQLAHQSKEKEQCIAGSAGNNPESPGLAVSMNIFLSVVSRFKPKQFGFHQPSQYQ
jgi:hypothetical protein